MFDTVPVVNTWSEFATADPWLSSSIRALLNQYGPGMAYLATIRADGGPRVHPVSPIVSDEGLFCFVVASPKRADLDRDGRYALHTFPSDTSDVEAYLTGFARQVVNVSTVDRIASRHRAAATIDWTLYEFTIETAMLHRQEPGVAPLVWHSKKGPAFARRTPTRLIQARYAAHAVDMRAA